MMIVVVRLVPVALGLALLVVLSMGSAIAARSETNDTSARAFAIQVAVPGQAGASAASVAAPPDAVGVGGSFAYPADGSVVSAGSVTSGAFATPGSSATASASAQVSTISIFGGDVTVSSVTAKSRASANSSDSGADSLGSAVSGLVVGGQAVTPGAATQFALGDWGYVVTLQEGKASLDAKGTKGARAFVTALQVRLTAEHYGLPAGTEVMVGYAESAAKVEVAAKPEAKQKHAPKAPAPKRKAKKKPVKGPGVGPEKPSFQIRPPP